MSLFVCHPRENPFRSGCIDALRYVGVSAEAIVARWESHGCRGALVGPCGTGKSTLLREVVPRLETRGFSVEFWALRSDELRPGVGAVLRRARGWRGNTVVVIDGAEQLGRAAWLTARARSRRGAGMLITTHVPGWLPCLHEHETPAFRAVELVDALLPGTGTDPQRVARVHQLHHELRGNIRDLFQELYHDAAEGGLWRPILHRRGVSDRRAGSRSPQSDRRGDRLR